MGRPDRAGTDAAAARLRARALPVLPIGAARTSRRSPSTSERPAPRPLPSSSVAPAALASANVTSPTRRRSCSTVSATDARSAGSNGITSSTRSTDASSRTAVTILAEEAQAQRRFPHGVPQLRKVAEPVPVVDQLQQQWDGLDGTTEPALERRLQRHGRGPGGGGRRRNARCARPRRAAVRRVPRPTVRARSRPRTGPRRSTSGSPTARAASSARSASFAARSRSPAITMPSEPVTMLYTSQNGSSSARPPCHDLEEPTWHLGEDRLEGRVPRGGIGGRDDDRHARRHGHTQAERALRRTRPDTSAWH